MGFLKAAIIIALILLPFSSFAFSRPYIGESVVAKQLLQTLRVAGLMASPSLVKAYERKAKVIQEKIDNRVDQYRMVSEEVEKANKYRKKGEEISEADRKKLEEILKENLR